MNWASQWMYAVKSCTWIVFSKHLHDWISMKLWVFSLFSSFPLCPHHLSNLPPCFLAKPLMFCSCSPLIASWMGLKWKLLFWETFTNAIQWSFACHLLSSYNHCSADGVVPPCMFFCSHKLFLFPNWAFSMHAVLRTTELLFRSKCTNGVPWNSEIFLFSSFPLSPHHGSNLPPCYLSKALMRCSCRHLTCELNGADMEVAFLRNVHECNSMNLCLSIISPPHSPFPYKWGISTMHGACVITHGFYFHELIFPYAHCVTCNWMEFSE